MSNSKQPSCADTGMDSSMLTVAEARTRILEQIAPITQTETLTLHAALGRVLALPLHAPLSLPTSDHSAMDGYAFKWSPRPDEMRIAFNVVGTSRAGLPFMGEIPANGCVRIMTGAVVPPGADTVVMQEHVQLDGNRALLERLPPMGSNIRRHGEEIVSGEVVLDAGRCLTPADLGVAASLGFPKLTVHRLPRVAFFSTGDELRPIGDQLPPGCIYDSNRYTLHGALSRLGIDPHDLGTVPDDPRLLQEALRAAADNADAIITTGGASVGDADLVQEALSELGTVNFWRVAMKPGRPLIFGRIGSSHFFGLPGNPVSVLATFYQFVQPGLRRLMGDSSRFDMSLQATTTATIRKKPGRMEFQRGRLTFAANCRALVEPTGSQSSAQIKSMSQANCFIVLPADCGDLPPDTVVEVQPFAGMI